MSACCPHPEAGHQLVAICQQVIHYPSEDYPCLCTGFAGAGEKCERCEHARAQHSRARVCGACSCRVVVG